MNSENSYKIDRRKLKLLANEYVQYNNDIYKITQILDASELIGVNIKTKKAKRLLINDLKPVDMEQIPENDFIHRDLSDISDSDWKEMERRFTAIQPILNNGSREEVEEYAKKAGAHFTTVYKWARGYTSTGTLTGLLPRKRGRSKGEVRIEQQAEKIIQKAIEEHYLKRIKPSVQYVINVVLAECQKKNLTPPSKNTIRNRISQISEYQRAKRRGSKSETRTKFEPAPGEFIADYPLQIVQIDHTKMDVIIVDEETRRPIGRPFITLAIDVYSRMITGYHMSLDAPSGLSVAMCVANSILPKNEWLMKMGIESNWDVWGFMDTLHADNGADFRAEALTEACRIHEINLQWRPVNKTNYGGHIERLIGTLMKAIHTIPGTTFSNIRERLDYDSEGNASMTFHELELWLVTFITKIYHKQKHSTLGMSPEAKWEEGVFGTPAHKGTGLPPRPADAETLLIDFLPLVKRKIRKTGVHINSLKYYDFVLRSFIEEENSANDTSKKDYTFRIDPNDISYIWFYEEKSRLYHKVSLANRAIPSMSLSEYNAIKANLTPQQKSSAYDAQIIRAHEELREMASDSAKKTKKVRRAEEKKKIHQKSNSVTNLHIQKMKPLKEEAESVEEFDEGDIPVFDVFIEGGDNA
ncbi:MAG: DDE-type integrase/transposase/recombinase [Sulfurimonas sp.]|uniref:Mu transposase C-terminal domain-containing protein n=1 Tax=Sulfurimonas sp. TaxID=2022749 RepID=UPI00261B4C8B|nr:Mu transposase C-terminal domain-containing protein [Sulfurimonas sp.]MDD2653245.1 DDE-type integrase/transposase/recombinase [Sulfurimonas sp.]MDD3452292.1 DDE-type integrase/transposase/recombinase [Sulfurimonas sp.]